VAKEADGTRKGGRTPCQNIWWKRILPPKAQRGSQGRRHSASESVKKHLEDVGGKLESMYFAFGDVDCFVIVDLPDNVSAAALSLAVNESGMIASKAIVLLTPQEMDEAGKTKVHFRAPGKKAPT
jgi:uncharacterized protein with GYD domain